MSLPGTVREVRLARRPQGRPVAADLTVAEVPAPEPAEGRVLLRNRWFLLYPGLATLLGDTPPGTPIPSVEPGDTLFGPAVGEVLHAPADSGLRPGDLVSHFQGWREYAVADPAELTPLEEKLTDPAAQLSPGAIGYGALTRTAPVAPGDTVLITGAAGAVGTMAGQIARLLGARTVLGTTGSPAKAERLRELGYDAVLVDERTADGTAGGPGRAERFARQLAEAAPDGIDVLLDTVGGHQAEAALAAARPGARVALVGVLSEQFGDVPGAATPLRLDAFQVIVKGVRLAGYSNAGYAEAVAEWLPRFGDWLRSGEITFPHVKVAGLERAPQAFQELIEGRHFGAVLVEL
ncbi:NADP-dependent oxidoreductase [Kitasatospora sp. NA04385]|uniref:MDR family NADP-dependent oxidoreductase n=1 Tax=Kitasatospora sp. NA04385 TaxID=2742135 RepID=UPI0015907A09|nr:NADP-dependent oxidoreductase [Kitasatospora sp. NA04385]QKW18999.1 NADP-dependent oxidoreductase [Kitasatospora sp. NA04385]